MEFYGQIDTLESLQALLKNQPDGTTADILAQDLEAGNFDKVTFVYPNGEGTYHMTYTGPVREGYVSPFEQGE